MRPIIIMPHRLPPFIHTHWSSEFINIYKKNLLLQFNICKQFNLK